MRKHKLTDDLEEAEVQEIIRQYADAADKT